MLIAVSCLVMVTRTTMTMVLAAQVVLGVSFAQKVGGGCLSASSMLLGELSVSAASALNIGAIIVNAESAETQSFAEKTRPGGQQTEPI